MSSFTTSPETTAFPWLGSDNTAANKMPWKRDSVMSSSASSDTSERSQRTKPKQARRSSETITSLLALLEKSFTDEQGRKELYDAAMNLAYSVESAQDTAQRLYHGHLPLSTAQIGLDIGLFSFLSSHAEGEYALGELAMVTGTEPALLDRLLRYYASQSMIHQTSKGTYTASNITHNLSIPGTGAGIKHYSLTMTPVYNKIPQFLAKTKYRNPVDTTPFNLAYNTDMPVFEWRKHNPENAKVGQAFMAAQRMGQRSVWDGQVPMDDWRMSPEDLAAGRVLMCDVGGGLGHQCLDFRRHHPELHGHIVTEDLSLVQNMIANHDELESMDIATVEHDFTQAQPVKGAKVYYLRNVIHNWNDKASQNILSQISKVMAEDSVCIVDDVVLPQVGATWKQASMDLAMMAMLASMERTEDHFAQLLADSGLRLREMWTYDQDYRDTFIVAELAK